MLNSCAHTGVSNARQLCIYRSVECSTAVHIQKCGMLNSCAHTEVWDAQQLCTYRSVCLCALLCAIRSVPAKHVRNEKVKVLLMLR
jgi:hypothetical protein